MKKNKIIYWTTTGIFSAFMLLTAFAYFADPQIVDAYKHMGFPDYFRIELGIAKLLGALALIIPKTPLRIKEWTYAGFSIMLFSGVIAHCCSGDSIGKIINVLFFFALLIISYIYWHKRNNEKLNSSII